MQNYFETLSDALHSEGLADAWPIDGHIPYGTTCAVASAGRWISVYRCETGRYERPVHYATLMADTGLIHLS
jgi:hypothetical protein